MSFFVLGTSPPGMSCSNPTAPFSPLVGTSISVSAMIPSGTPGDIRNWLTLNFQFTSSIPSAGVYRLCAYLSASVTATAAFDIGVPLVLAPPLPTVSPLSIPTTPSQLLTLTSASSAVLPTLVGDPVAIILSPSCSPPR